MSEVLTYKSNHTIEAWYKYIDKGDIDQSLLRPVIARSWERCSQYSLDPWMAPQRCQEFSLLESKRQVNEQLISAALPVLNYVFALTGKDENISLSDQDGFVVELICALDNYPLTLGCIFNEKSAGTNPIGIALAEGIPVLTHKFEHYAACYHSYSGASVPIKNNVNNIVGILNAVSPHGDLSPYILELLVQGSLLISERLVSREGSLERTDYFSKMMNCVTSAVLIYDAKGQFITANERCLKLLSMNSNSLCSHWINDVIIDYEKDISENFSLKTKNQIISCVQIKKASIEGATVLIFDSTTNKRAGFKSKSNKIDKDIVEEKIIGNSQTRLKLVTDIRKAAPYSSTVLIEGESGTGKELVAQAIHQASGRTGPFIAMNCGAIPKELLQSELFGYEAGSFTGARSGGYIGKFELANKGTIFLDEIGEMPLDMQVSLLRFLQEKAIVKIGSNKTINLDVRVIAATNKRLINQVKALHFREDLYYRLNVVNIMVPPLRNRKTDIPLLVDFFITDICNQFEKEIFALSENAMSILCQYSWPGNIRELKNVIERIAIFAESDIVDVEALPEYIIKYKPAKSNQLDNDLENPAKSILIQTLEMYNGNITKSAKALNISRNTLYKRMKEMNIQIDVNLDW